MRVLMFLVKHGKQDQFNKFVQRFVCNLAQGAQEHFHRCRKLQEYATLIFTEAFTKKCKGIGLGSYMSIFHELLLRGFNGEIYKELAQRSPGTFPSDLNEDLMRKSGGIGPRSSEHC